MNVTSGARHLALVGPTASGKSALAFDLAREAGDIEIVSLDSMQVYRGMDIGTAKPTAGEQAAVPHHLIDVVDPDTDWSVARTQAEARACLRAIEARGRRAVLVGGTGLYVRAVVDGLDLPGEDLELRATLDAEARTDAGLASAYRRLQALDPVAAARIEPHNRRRIVRALEVIELTGRRFSSFGPGVDHYAAPAEPVQLIGVWLPRAVLARRIAARVATMRAAGFVDEVAMLAARPAGLSRTAAQAIGYRELLAAVAGECSVDDALDVTVARTRAFARRQRMWFRRDPRIRWLGTTTDPRRLLPALRALAAADPIAVPA